MNWFYYLLEANLYLAAFYLLYKLLLQNSTFYNSNRYFLVLSIVVAFTIPLIQLGFLKPQILLPAEEVVYDFPVETIELAKVAPAPTLTKEDYIIYGYLILAALLCLKFILSIAKIIKIYAKSEKRELDGYTLVEVAAEHTAFSFFNILFIHPDMIKNNTVLRHEIIHIKQKHSWDIILLELLKIFCWFNPVVYLIKRDLTLLHEYIADERTTSGAISKHEYAMFLIENSMASYSPSLVNQFFNQSILKSRINMLNKEKTANWARLKYLLAVPLGVGLLCASTLGFSKSYGFVEIGPKSGQKQETKQAEGGKTFYPKNEYPESKDRAVTLDKRYIVVNNKPITDVANFHGVSRANKITYLNASDAIKKYGDKAKNGAVEITGDNLKYLELSHPQLPPLSPKPPKVKKDQVKFPPPVVKKNKARTGAAIVKPDQVKFPTTYYPKYKHDKEGNYISLEERLIVVNGKIITDKNKYHGTAEADKIIFLNRKDAIKKYGSEEGKNGAIEIYGEKAVFTFPPPIVKPDKKADSQKSVDDIELTEKTTNTKSKASQNQLNNKINKVILAEINKSRSEPGFKERVKEQIKTGALKKEKQEITPAKETFQKTNNVFSKAWTLYKPKVEENKNDKC